ncbi:pentapeptide repeat-containing protein [Pseudarthrobacter sp. R1]
MNLRGARFVRCDLSGAVMRSRWARCHLTAAR